MGYRLKTRLGVNVAIVMKPHVDRTSSVRIFRPAHHLLLLVARTKKHNYKRDPPVPHLNEIDRIE